MKKILALYVVLVGVLSVTSVFAQSTGFQSFSNYNVAVSCSCVLKPAATIEENILMATVPLDEKMPPLKEKASAYECTDNRIKADYHLEITDKKAVYNSLSLTEYESTVQSKLDDYTLKCSKRGSIVKRVRIEGVYGISQISHIGDLAIYNIYFIKNGMEYILQVSGRERTGTDYQQVFVEFVKSFKML